MDKTEIEKVVDEIYVVFSSWTDLGAEDNEVTDIKNSIKKIIKRITKAKNNTFEHKT